MIPLTDRFAVKLAYWFLEDQTHLRVIYPGTLYLKYKT